MGTLLFSTHFHAIHIHVKGAKRKSKPGPRVCMNCFGRDLLLLCTSPHAIPFVSVVGLYAINSLGCFPLKPPFASLSVPVWCRMRNTQYFDPHYNIAGIPYLLYTPLRIHPPPSMAHVSPWCDVVSCLQVIILEST